MNNQLCVNQGCSPAFHPERAEIWYNYWIDRQTELKYNLDLIRQNLTLYT